MVSSKDHLDILSFWNLVDHIITNIKTLQVSHVLKHVLFNSINQVVTEIQEDEAGETLEASAAETCVTVGLEHVATEVHDDHPGEGMEQSAGQD